MSKKWLFLLFLIATGGAFGMLVIFTGEQKNHDKEVLATQPDFTPEEAETLYETMSPEEKASLLLDAHKEIKTYLTALKEEAPQDKPSLTAINNLEQTVRAIKNKAPVAKTTLRTAITVLRNSSACTSNNCHNALQYATILSFSLPE